ncbi:MAG: hypothetical protein QM308_07740 [Bacillota bacterium]|nr:hypothetical protein [Bacillota bacterium]
MNTSKKLRITITLLSLAAVLCVLLGKSIIYVPGFTLSYSFIDALFPPADTSFLPSTTIYVWILVIGSLITCVLVWLRHAWAALAGCAASLSSLVYHVIRSIQNGYSVFQIDGIWEFFMLALPLVSAVLCIVLYRDIKQE